MITKAAKLKRQITTQIAIDQMYIINADYATISPFIET